ncbi:hypothetical protein [Roseimaritima ulvae]|uniref:Neutral/alkaline non-lysosomal ceramidase n=1 Tax=Roseimaritima ulvae TaxID=980254 RepID=A0A5B9QRK2_9BACT|nr:hypothetical protein [Roseimaritima ulvae]QEG39965.1 hypothetical protein UC8_19680 [Roseimaritima ulvae]
MTAGRQLLVVNRLAPLLLLVLIGLTSSAQASDDPPPADPPLRIATFDLDATPPVGSMMAYDRVRRVDELELRCRGVVLLGADKPIVLCAIDWIGVANEAHDIFRATLAEAAGTTPDRVTVHALHQHDAPRCDFSAERILHELGVSDLGTHDSSFTRPWLQGLKPAVADAIAKAKPVTHAGYGVADVEKVASNRRIPDEQGMIRAVRYTTCRDPKLRAEPEGVVDRQLSSLSFWDNDQPVAVLTYYATHPQSYYRTGVPSPDFPGIARFMRGQDMPDTLHVHFNGAGGNIGAGKYNDGSKKNRMILAGRMADAMERAYQATTKFPLAAESVGWDVVSVELPPAKHLDAEKLREQMSDPAIAVGLASRLAWLQRCQSGHKIDLACLKVGDVRVLHMPGELFVEYQLAAKALRPDLKVAMAAYGDYGTAYIGTAEAYGQGGYETSERATNVDARAEPILMDGIRQLLEVQQ